MSTGNVLSEKTYFRRLTSNAYCYVDGMQLRYHRLNIKAESRDFRGEFIRRGAFSD